MDLQEWCYWYKRRGAGRLRHIMMRYWDPIGVAGAPGARDEYDSYIGLVADLLREGRSVDQVADLLQSIRTNLMEQPIDRGTDLRAAEALHRWYSREMAGRG